MDLQDLFLIGLACDMVGAVLLAKGLLIPLSRLPAPGLEETAFGYGITGTADRIRDRVDATWGLAALLLGFFLQAVGYVGQLGWDPTPSSGSGPAIVAVLLAVAIACVILVAWRQTRDLHFKRVAVRTVLAYGRGEGWTRQRARMLVQVGVAGGFGIENSEPSPGSGVQGDEDWDPYA